MIPAYWNALRVGDAVLVHDVAALDTRLRPAHVAMVDARHRHHDVGVRIDGLDKTGWRIRWPSRLRVHLAPVGPADPCRWCADPRPALDRSLPAPGSGATAPMQSGGAASIDR